MIATTVAAVSVATAMADSVAIATAGEKQFGKGESALTPRLPLMVRPSPPPTSRAPWCACTG